MDFCDSQKFITTSPPNIGIKVIMLVVKCRRMSLLETSTLDSRTQYHMITYVVLGIPLKNMYMVGKRGYVHLWVCVHTFIMPRYVCIQGQFSLFSGQSHLYSSFGKVRLGGGEGEETSLFFFKFPVRFEAPHVPLFSKASRTQPQRPLSPWPALDPAPPLPEKLLQW